MITKRRLKELYVDEKQSTKQISEVYGCSENKIHYWLKKYHIPKRSIKDATYLRANPTGDPFNFKTPSKPYEYFLYGLGLGLFWGEGNKANLQSVRLGNSDPELIRYFIEFLDKIYKIEKNRLRFGLQLFTDCDICEAQNFWCSKLDIKQSQFHKTVITKQHKLGSYHKKSQYGVLTVYFSNRKLRDMIVGAINALQNNKANVAQLVERIHGEVS